MLLLLSRVVLQVDIEALNQPVFITDGNGILTRSNGVFQKVRKLPVATGKDFGSFRPHL